MENCIQVAIGIESEKGGVPIQFFQFDEGVKFAGEYTINDLIISSAILRDLADAIDSKVNSMSN